MPDGYALYAPICRVDEAKREVWAEASTEQLGADGKILGFDASVRAFGAWPGNLRESHDPNKAIGRAVHWEPQADTRTILLGARISRGAEDSWLKVLDGTLRFFSVKGPIKHVEMRSLAVGGVQRAVPFVTDYDLEEVSLVDRPGDLGVSAFTIVRAAAATDGVDDGTLVMPADLPDLLRALSHAPLTGGHSHEHAAYGMAGDSNRPHSHQHTHGGEGDGASDADHDHDHAGAHAVQRTGAPTPAEVPPMRATPPPLQRDADAGAEQGDIALAQQALALVRQLIGSEAGEVAAGDSDDLWQVSLLGCALSDLQAFISGETYEAVMAQRSAHREATDMSDLTDLAAVVRAQVELSQTQGQAIAALTSATSTLLERMQTTEQSAQVEATAEAEAAVQRAATAEQQERQALVERIARLEAQPLPGGPVLRTEGLPVEKLFPGFDRETADQDTVTRVLALLGDHAEDPTVRDRSQLSALLEMVRSAPARPA